jgi:ATP-binding cassette subfamily B protein/subfamily B ATP-binding cassette protein MsbA
MHNYLRLLAYARRYRGSFLLIFVLTLAVSGLVALQPWPIKILIDHVLEPKPLPAVLEKIFLTLSIEPTRWVLLTIVVGGGLVLFALSSAADAVLSWTWTVTGRRLVFDVAEDLFARLQRRSLTFHKRMPVGDVMSRVTVDSWSVYQIVDTLVVTPAHALLTMLTMIALMTQLNLQLTLIALALAPFMVAVSFLLGKPLRAAAKLKREIESRIQAHIQQTLTGIPVVQAFGQEEHESQRFARFADAAIRTQQRSALLGSVNSLSSGLVTTLGSGAILWLGARHVLEGKLTIGGILVFLVYLNSLQAQMKIFAGLYPALQNLSASASRVVEILDATSEIPEQPGAPSLPALRGDVVFDRVTTGYDLQRPVLRNISFAANAGQTIAIVGATGTGKTTLVNLIPRFLEAWTGRVLLDGYDVRDVRLASLREQTAMVPQETFLFPVSIAENISFAKPDASRADIEAAARAAHAHDFILRLPEGYDTVIGERGATLSGGERQRLSLARAFLRNAPILVLDEPTSALDSETERLIFDAWQRLAKGRTTFIIAHRLATARRADCILVLKDGAIIESGTHDELMLRAGHYAHLHRLQIHGEISTLTVSA